MKIDHSIFVHDDDLIIIVYVDNLFIVDFNIENIIVFKLKFKNRFKIKKLNFVFFYLKVKIVKNFERRSMHLNQSTFIKQLIDECEFIDCKSISFSMKIIQFKITFNEKSYFAIFEKI